MTRCCASPKAGLHGRASERRRVYRRALVQAARRPCANSSPIWRMRATTRWRLHVSCSVMAETRKPLLPACPKVRAGSTEEEDACAPCPSEGLVTAAWTKIGGRSDADARHAYRRTAGLRAWRYRQRWAFPGYFLIVADFIQWAKKGRGIPVGPGRGSGAGSVAAWALTITDLDPLQFNLLFERFLNPERISMPDFDIDFCQNRRDEVIDYVRARIWCTSAWPRSSPSANCRPAPRCAMSGACSGMTVRPRQQAWPS